LWSAATAVAALHTVAMLSYEPELEQLRPLLGDPTTATLIARERREVFSLHPELRILSWGGAMLLATAAGLVLKNNLDRIGPLALAVLIGIAAASCYAFVWWRRARASVVHDYVLLLGALLVSADVAFIESQFHLLGDAWHRHFLILAIVHGVAAYLFRSRLVLSLSIVAVTAWLGVRETPFGNGTDYAMRALGCAALLLMWRAAHLRFDAAPASPAEHPPRDFAPTLEHFAANVAFAGTIALMFEDRTRILGCLFALIVAAAVIFWGMRTRRETFVLYAFLYAVLAVDVLFAEVVDEEALIFFFIVLSVIGAIVALFAIHSRVREWRA
ncbi:MAG TPA: DUF2157 domain-containing protein, partial [Thermoanaerobaculia bacterium]|nr:DUF2157 domain-containing protein [Thermoanaerobaculia bacterium]